jgi:diaminobutyrate-2-oxoglutarate transaminase
MLNTKDEKIDVQFCDRTSTTFDRMESQVQSYARNFPKVFDKALGSEVWDIDGNRYLDFLSGAGSLNYGHNHPIMKKALLDYISSDAISNSLDLHTLAKEEFLETFDEIILKPRELDYVIQFCGPTGTNAIEAALKIARKVTGRTNVVAFTNGFHGMTAGALAATANSQSRGGAGMPLSGISRMPFEDYLGPEGDTIAYLDKMICDPSSGLDLPAAVLVETVQGEGGHKAASMEWLQSLEALCRRHAILLIVDEIQSGCGRTGTFFSFEPADIKPDIVTLSKSISGYGLPLALVLFGKELDIWKPGEHNGTFRGNNLAFVTATTTLKNFWQDKSFEIKLAQKGTHLKTRLYSIQSKYHYGISEVRGRGLMQGLVFNNPEDAATVTKLAFEAGVIAERVGPQDEVVKIMAPITITNDHFDEGIDVIEQSISRTFEKQLTKKAAKEVRLLNV